MRDIPEELQNHLDTGATTLARCWRITRKDGVTLGFTDHDRELVVDGYTFEASTGFLSSEIESQLGLAVDNLDVFGALDSTKLVDSEIEAGLFDAAEVLMYLVNWQDTAQFLLEKKGYLGSVTRGHVLFQAEVRGISTELSQTKGRKFNYTCDALLGDARCKVSLVGYTNYGTVASGSTTSLLRVSGLTDPTGYYSHGVITMDATDPNKNKTLEIKSHEIDGTTALLSLWEPLPFEPTTGLPIQVRAGCDKSFKTCKAKFDNSVNFRGFPHVPGNSTVLTYVGDGDPDMDGGGNFLGKD